MAALPFNNRKQIVLLFQLLNWRNFINLNLKLLTG